MLTVVLCLLADEGIDVGALKTTKDITLARKQAMNSSYADAGTQLSGQCKNLQGMTKSIAPNGKKRKAEGGSSQGTVVG
jgi:hypothetical protein